MISTIIFLVICGFLAIRYRIFPFMANVSKSEVAPGIGKRTKTWFIDSTFDATENPGIAFKAMQNMFPLSLRFTAKVLDRSDGNETYVISLEDDGTKITTNNPAATAVLGTYEATFEGGAKIASGSVVEIIFTLGGTTPHLGGICVELDYAE